MNLPRCQSQHPGFDCDQRSLSKSPFPSRWTENHSQPRTKSQRSRIRTRQQTLRNCMTNRPTDPQADTQSDTGTKPCLPSRIVTPQSGQCGAGPPVTGRARRNLEQCRRTDGAMTRAPNQPGRQTNQPAVCGDTRWRATEPQRRRTSSQWAEPSRRAPRSQALASRLPFGLTYGGPPRPSSPTFSPSAAGTTRVARL